jgi:hypothetical protein
VRRLMNSSSPPSFTFPAAPIGSLIQGARPDLLPPALVVWGLAGAFRLFQMRCFLLSVGT